MTGEEFTPSPQCWLCTHWLDCALQALSSELRAVDGQSSGPIYVASVLGGWLILCLGAICVCPAQIGVALASLVRIQMWETPG